VACESETDEELKEVMGFLPQNAQHSQ